MTAALVTDEAIEVRVARLESHAAYTLSKVGDHQLDTREIRNEIRELREQLRKELAALHAEIRMIRK